MPKNVLVTYDPGEKKKAVIADVLGTTARITYLPEVSGSARQRVLAETDAVLGKSLSHRELPPEDLNSMTRLRFIQVVFAGADAIPFEHIPEQIIVANNPGAFAQPIAEHVLAMTLCLAKSLLVNHHLLAQGRFEQNVWNKPLKGRICGIIGLGGNGRETAAIMQAVGMKVFGINRSGESDLPLDFLGTMQDLPRLLRESDVLVLCVPLTRQTHDLIGEQELRQMKPEAMLINVARGDVINQGALYRHLQDNPNFCACIDTWWKEPGTHGAFALDYPFFDLPNLLGSPHNADDVPGIMTEAVKRATENIRQFLNNEPIVGRVDRSDYQGLDAVRAGKQ